MNPINIDELLKILPTLIRENDTVKGAIITALSGVVATKEDIKELILQMDKRFEALQQQMDKRFEALQQQMDKRFEALQQQMDKRFEALQQQMDKRFEALQQQMDKRFKAVDKRFEAMDKRFEALQQQMDKRFKAVDKRFEAMDKRFEALQQQMDKRFKAMDKRFEAMDKRFEALQQQMDKRFKAMDKRFDRLEGALTEIRLVLGRPFEQFARNVVTRILQAEGFQRIDLRSIKLEDPKRTVSSATTDVEIDGLSLDPPVIIEITSILKEHSKIDNFLRKKAFVESLYHKKFRGFLVAASTQLSAEEIATITIELRKNNAELINL
ncbi:MAG: hypothetical protein ACTSYB_16000 [Candidatus Helarchaeota archaeon]